MKSKIEFKNRRVLETLSNPEIQTLRTLAEQGKMTLRAMAYRVGVPYKSLREKAIREDWQVIKFTDESDKNVRGEVVEIVCEEELIKNESPRALAHSINCNIHQKTLNSSFILAEKQKEFAETAQVIVDKAFAAAAKMSGAAILSRSSEIKNIFDVGRRNLNLEKGESGDSAKTLIINVLKAGPEGR